MNTDPSPEEEKRLLEAQLLKEEATARKDECRDKESAGRSTERASCSSAEPPAGVCTAAAAIRDAKWHGPDK